MVELKMFPVEPVVDITLKMVELKMVPIEPVVDITLHANDLAEGHLSDDYDYFRSRKWYSRSKKWYSSSIVDECNFPNDTCLLLSSSDFYKPTTEDVGKVLVLEVEGEGSLVTKPVIPFPSPRQMVQIKNDTNKDGSFTSPSFTIVTYNVLADVYATSQQFPNCPSFALKWAYRRQNLLKEILQCDPDIICLQEVQQNHFIYFFGPELRKLGYAGVFKEKERQPPIPTVDCCVDGCATFYKLNQFHLESHWSIHLVYRDNIALQVILSFNNADQRLCITNTHIHANPKNRDIKLLQVDYLVKTLEAYVMDHPDLTLVLCGDFNSLPGSAVHSLLTKGSVHPSHQELSRFHPSDRLKFIHTIPIGNAYLSYSRCAVPLEEVLKKIDSQTGEPRFTNSAQNPQGKFHGTLDYILYSAKKLKVVSLLELIDEDEVKDRALPSVKRSSDHIPLAAEFKYISASE